MKPIVQHFMYAAYFTVAFFGSLSICIPAFVNQEFLTAILWGFLGLGALVIGAMHFASAVTILRYGRL